MQISALDQEKTLVSVHEALSQKKYFCPECFSPVFLRGGKWKRRHFYHTKHTVCRLAGKSSIHLQIQYALQKMVAPALSHLEYRFKTINRIADFFWPDQNLVFEVQCSPISADEIAARNADYAKIGLTTIWILHDKRYNRFHLTAAEAFLLPFPHYFTSINDQGIGMIYDQYSWLKGHKRFNRTAKFPIHLKHLNRLHVSSKNFNHLPKERQKWPLSFGCDLFHQSISFTPQSRSIPFSFTHHLKPLLSWWYYLLESFCN